MSCPILWTPRFYRLSTFVDTALLPSVRFCGHRAFTVCPLLWTPRFYRLSTFVDTALLLPVHFCGHRAFTVCPVLWTPRFYRLSTFVDTTLLLSARFCGHHAFTVCPLLWTPCFLLSVHFCGHRAFTACPLLWTPCFLLSVHFCGHPAFYFLSTFVDTALFTVCPILRTFSIHGNAKFQYIGICNGAVLRVNNGLLPNIIAFTLNFSLCSRCIIPVYWNLQWRNFLIKRGKIALLPSVTAKTCCASFPARAERVEFSRPSLLRLNTYSARSTEYVQCTYF